MAGPDIPQGNVCRTPVSLVDIYPTVLDAVGIDLTAQERNMPGHSLLDIARQTDNIARPVFCEYHATAAKSGEFMLRNGRYKFIYYVGVGAELYDLEDDPEEMQNLAENAEFAGLAGELEAALRAIVDPEEVDRRAKRDQAALLESYGGREAVLKRGVVSATPAPV
jgi:choline-sulfatase